MKRPLATAALKERFAKLLGGLRVLLTRGSRVDAEESPDRRRMFETRLAGYLEARGRWAASQVECADDFNLFEVLDVEHDEVRHSKLLAWLLDRRIDRATHAQGNLGFRLFIEELQRNPLINLPPEAIGYANEPYWVTREVPGDESRVDIEIAAREKFIIHIENKILSVEGPEQTEREWNELERRGRELGISISNTHALFLTLDGSLADDKNFRSVGWRRIASVLERFAVEAKPPEVRLFARHYAKAIHALAISSPTQSQSEESENGNTAIP